MCPCCCSPTLIHHCAFPHTHTPFCCIGQAHWGLFTSCEQIWGSPTYISAFKQCARPGTFAFSCHFTQTCICTISFYHCRVCICSKQCRDAFLGLNNDWQYAHAHTFLPGTLDLVEMSVLVAHVDDMIVTTLFFQHVLLVTCVLCLFYLHYLSKIVLFYWVQISDSCLLGFWQLSVRFLTALPN